MTAHRPHSLHDQSDNRQISTRLIDKKPNYTANDDDDDDIFIPTSTTDDDQARIRRRAPTRHSIKSLSGRKPSSKPTINTEVQSNELDQSFIG
jgi:hypothetical protein